MLTAINEGCLVVDEVVEKFRPTSGRIPGGIALALVAAVVLISVFDRDNAFPPAVIWGALFGGSLAWAAMLRPRLWATRNDLVMRNMASTVTIPLAAIEKIAVRQVVVVLAGEQRFVSPAVGTSWRQAVRSGKSKPGASPTYVSIVDDRLHQLAEAARLHAGVTLLSDEQETLAKGIRRAWAWPEIAAMAVTAVGFLLTFVL